MDQPIPEGSVRNSHRDSNPIKRKFASKRVGDAARELVNGCSQYGPIIRQRLDLERMKLPLQKGIFYVIENDGLAEPGFLVFLPEQAPVFLQTKTKAAPPCTLRMRVSPTLGEGGGTVIVATLDLIQHSLRLEDVWMWKGEAIYDTNNFSRRREKLKEFVEHCWIPDARLLGGIMTTVLNPKSVEKAFTTISPSVHTYELIPEMAGKRRMWLEAAPVPLTKAVAIPVPKAATPEPKAATPVPKAATPVPLTKAVATPVTKAVATPEPTGLKRVLAKSVDKMPDIYDIYSETNEHMGKASVQQFALSQRLRSETTAEGTWVFVEWREEFNGYEIKKIC
jgi:hypothetical protein